MWVYLNWALGLRQLGCRVIWLELVEPSSMEKLATLAELLKNRLTRYGLSDSLALGFPTEERPGGCIPTMPGR